MKGFKPGSPLNHAILGSEKDLSNELKLKHFAHQIEISIEHAHANKKNLLLREHTHTTYPFKGQHGKMGILEFLNSGKEWQPPDIHLKQMRPILTTRHPLDNYLSARAKNWHKNYTNSGSFDEYCKAIYIFQEAFQAAHNPIILRYEDLCSSKDVFLKDLATGLKEKQNNIPNDGEINKIQVSGKSGRSTSSISPRKRQFHLIEKDLESEVTHSEWFKKLCTLNSYIPEINESLIL